MKTAIVRIFVIALCLILFHDIQAQWVGGMNLKVYDPQGSFNRNMNSLPVGMSLVGHRKGKGRLSIGGEIGVAMYTNDQYNYDLTAEGYPGQSVEVDEEDCFWTAHASLKYEMFSSPSVVQYVELRVGATTFFSSIVALEESYGAFEDKFEFHGTAFNTGIGTGVMLNPGSIFSGGEDQSQWWIDFGLNVHSGSKTDYRNFEMAEKDKIGLEDGNFRSLTTYIDYRFGIMIEI